MLCKHVDRKHHNMKAGRKKQILIEKCKICAKNTEYCDPYSIDLIRINMEANSCKHVLFDGDRFPCGIMHPVQYHSTPASKYHYKSPALVNQTPDLKSIRDKIPDVSLTKAPVLVIRHQILVLRHQISNYKAPDSSYTAPELSYNAPNLSFMSPESSLQAPD